ncbi:MAG: LLM class F420-dependent oxidoreductase [Actinobacteria bacterium]|nr:LLM class F420-dependent oxidoreductase [Actinomycetota bacterium]
MPRFGIQLPNFTHDVPDDGLFDHVAALAGAADETGFSSLWVMDHFFQLPPLGGPDQPMLEAYTLLGGLAARTSRVQLGTLVTGVTYRNPALLAKAVTTLDVMSRGRAILGIGAAWYDVEHAALGVDFPGAGERLDRLEEAVRICRAMFDEDGASFEGRHYRITEARNLPRPVRAGGIPIMIGGGGERRTLRLVAELADACNVTGPIDVVRHKIDVLHRHCADVGRDPGEVSVTWMTPLLLTTSEEHTRSMRELLRSADDPAAAEAAGFTIGQPEELAELVAPFAEAGVDEVIFSFAFGTPEDIRSVGAAVGLG